MCNNFCTFLTFFPTMSLYLSLDKAGKMVYYRSKRDMWEHNVWKTRQN